MLMMALAAAVFARGAGPGGPALGVEGDRPAVAVGDTVVAPAEQDEVDHGSLV